MKCLTLPEFQEWTGSFNVRVDGNRNLLFSKELTQIMSVFPKKADQLFEFSTALVGWLPPNIERTLYLSGWPLYTPEQMIMFKKLRLAGKETRHVIDAPAHLFDSRSLPNRFDIDDTSLLTADPILQECVVMAALIFLAITFQWQGYILAKNCNAHIYLGDEFIVFFSDEDAKLKSTHELLATYKLRIIQDMKEAWAQ